MSRRTPLVGFLLADAISLCGTRVSMIAIPWLVLTTTGSAAQTGLVAFAELLPLVVVQALAGPLIDRLGARRVAISCDLMSMVVVGLVPLLHLAGRLTSRCCSCWSPSPVGCAGPATAPSTRSCRRSPAARRCRSSASPGWRRPSSAPPASPVPRWPVPWWRSPVAANALIVDAVSFGVCAAVFAWSTATMRAERVDERPAGTTYVHELREGWTFLRKDHVLVAMSGMVAVTNLLDLAFCGVLLPVWIKESGYGVGVLGAYFATWAAASAIGSFVAAWAAERLPRFQVYLWAFLITGLPTVRAARARCAAVDGAGLVPGRRLRLRLPQPDPRGGDLRTGAGRRDGSGHHDQQRAVLVADAVRRPARRRAVRALGVAAALLVVGFAYLAATMAPLAIPAFRQLRQAEGPHGRAGAGSPGLVTALRASSTNGEPTCPGLA